MFSTNTIYSIGFRRSPHKKSADACFHCGMEGHWRGECPRRLHGFPKSVNTISGVDSSSSEEEEEANNVNVVRGEKSQIALFLERVDRFLTSWGRARLETRQVRQVSYENGSPEGLKGWRIFFSVKPPHY